jgi:RNA polymerase sigma factor (TIGR02999 family)
MAGTPSQDVTALLVAWSNGNRDALNELITLVHAELVAKARRYMAREHPGHPLQSHALVNEVYLRMVDMRRVDWQNRAHFFAVAARVMRHILVDIARAERGAKRGGRVTRVAVDEALSLPTPAAYDVLGLNDALDALTTLDPRRGQVVELRIFGGLTIDETASVLQVSADTVSRDWTMAKAWLGRELARSETGHES